MDSEDVGTKTPFFDNAAFDQVAHDAALRRATFMRTHPRAMLAIAGSATLLCGGALLIGVATRDTSRAHADMARRSYELEGRVNAATDQIEKFKSALERAGAIAPETASAIEQQLRQPVYDCNKTPCSASLQQRNYAVRAQLRALLAQKTLPGQAHKGALVHAADAKLEMPESRGRTDVSPSQTAGHLSRPIAQASDE